MTSRTGSVGIRLTPDEHEIFTEHINGSNEFNSMNQFFRTVAHRYIATEDNSLSNIKDIDKIVSEMGIREALDAGE